MINALDGTHTSVDVTLLGIVVTKLRINVENFQREPCMKIDLLGCTNYKGKAWFNYFCIVIDYIDNIDCYRQYIMNSCYAFCWRASALVLFICCITCLRVQATHEHYVGIIFLAHLAISHVSFNHKKGWPPQPSIFWYWTLCDLYTCQIEVRKKVLFQWLIKIIQHWEYLDDNIGTIYVFKYNNIILTKHFEELTSAPFCIKIFATFLWPFLAAWSKGDPS